jgi:hypothetical protein
LIAYRDLGPAVFGDGLAQGFDAKAVNHSTIVLRATANKVSFFENRHASTLRVAKSIPFLTCKQTTAQQRIATR